MKKAEIIQKIEKRILPLMMIIITLFMGIVYASVNSVSLELKGTLVSKEVDKVFITEINYDNDSNADSLNSNIRAYQTNVDSHIILSNNQDASITYKITFYNSTNIDYIYIGPEYIISELTYSNPNITFELTGIDEGYIITPGETKIAFLTFKYIGTDTSNIELKSSINFNFEKLPILELSNENETYKLENIYPNFEPQEYQFTVSNYNENMINEVEMNYNFSISIDKPLNAKIYDSGGNEVTGSINISSEPNKIDNIYTLKVFWDNSNSEENNLYNSVEYADKEFNCTVSLLSKPTSAEYKDYKIDREFNVDIKTSPLIFNPTLVSSIGMEKTKAQLPVKITNFDANNNYNNYDITYEMTISNHEKFTYSIGTETGNTYTKKIEGNAANTSSYNVDFNGDVNNVLETENVTVNIKTIEPYVKEYSFPIEVKLQPLQVKFNANGGNVSQTSLVAYKGRNYGTLPTPKWIGHTFNGWYTAATGGTKVTDTTEVTLANATQTLYAQWASRLLVDKVKPGDLVNYGVGYSNIVITHSSTNINVASGYTGWKVLDVVGTGNDKYVLLITSGIPLSFRCPRITTDTTNGQKCVTALTTNFFSTPINSTLTNYNFYKNGFTSATTIGAIKNLFLNNVHTQVDSSGNPIVRTPTKADIDGSLAWTAELNGTTAEVIKNLTDFRNNTLFGIKSTSTTYAYVPWYIATANESYYLWNSYLSGYVVYTADSSAFGIRPIVALKSTTEANGQVSSVWQIKEGTE